MVQLDNAFYAASITPLINQHMTESMCTGEYTQVDIGVPLTCFA